MGKIFLVNAVHNCAISEAGILQWQEHAVSLTSPVWHLCWWAEANFLKHVPPGGIKGNQCRGKPSQKDLNCDFLYLSFAFFQCKNMQDCLLWFVKWALGLYWAIHPIFDVLIYLAIQFWHLRSNSDSVDRDECFSLRGLQWQGYCGRNSKVDTYQLESVFL